MASDTQAQVTPHHATPSTLAAVRLDSSGAGGPVGSWSREVRDRKEEVGHQGLREAGGVSI